MKQELRQRLADWQWHAVATKNRELDGVFYFGVRTTGVFCRPSCSSRKPNRENVAFFITASDAEHAGFRPCLRCRPLEAEVRDPAPELIANAFRSLRNRQLEFASVEDLASDLQVSSSHLQKTFRNVLGITPKEVMDMFRLENFKDNVRGADVTTSLYDSGFGSSRSLYEKAGERLGMTPAIYKKGGKGMTVTFTVADSPLGKLLVAATDKGICSVSFGDNEDELRSELEKEFFAAEISNDDSGLKKAVDSILRGMNGERTILALPLDVRGTAFQMRVWSELRKIPYGETRSYSQVAENIGNPNAVRAVARACATNPVAVLTPCHRVVASDGKLAGYRWGIERKKALLDKEKAK
ncbi:MAG: bifunctional DNA-binding transcriptional regulator/O6-methylguanine-DNA methyltransferase Ada [Pyrinomonadaceae bacterium]